MLFVGGSVLQNNLIFLLLPLLVVNPKLGFLAANRVTGSAPIALNGSSASECGRSRPSFGAVALDALTTAAAV